MNENEGSMVKARVVAKDSDTGKYVMCAPGLKVYRGLLGCELTFDPKTARYNESRAIEVECVIDAPGSKLIKYLPLTMLTGVETAGMGYDLTMTADKHKRAIAIQAVDAAARLRNLRIHIPVEMADPPAEVATAP